MINDPPPVLYVRGELLPVDDWAVAMVGTRHASSYGKEAARVIATRPGPRGRHDCQRAGRGIDAQAHRAAIEAGGRTLAVLGSGVDIIYPWENAEARPGDRGTRRPAQ